MSKTYEIRCRECGFERTVDGVYRALDAADTHRTEAGSDHYVDVYLREYAPWTDEWEPSHGRRSPASGE